MSVDLSEVPMGATVRLVFEGKLHSGDQDHQFVNLTMETGDVVRVSWEQRGEMVEDFEPETIVTDYGFQPGDVVTYAAGTGLPVKRETLFATATNGGTGDGQITWVDSLGSPHKPDPSTLTLVMRNGLVVPQDDD